MRENKERHEGEGRGEQKGRRVRGREGDRVKGGR